MPLIEDTRGQLPFSHLSQWAAPAAPVVVAALLVCILQPLAVAGLKGMWKALGTTGSSAKKDREDRLRVVLEGKACGVELADRALHHTKAFCKDNQRAKKMCLHGRKGEALEDPEIAYRIANSIVAELKDLSATLGGATLYAVGEGVAEAKRHEKARCVEFAKGLLEAVPPKYAAAVTPTDCTMQLVREQIEALDDTYNITFVNPPGEGEAQLMSMLACGDVEHVLLGSGGRGRQRLRV